MWIKKLIIYYTRATQPPTLFKHNTMTSIASRGLAYLFGSGGSSSAASSSPSEAFQSACSAKKEIPEHLLCPISGDIMADPVLTEAFQTYDRVSIEEWFQRKRTDPLTNERVSRTLRPNVALAAAVALWKKEETMRVEAEAAAESAAATECASEESDGEGDASQSAAQIAERAERKRRGALERQRRLENKLAEEARRRRRVAAAAAERLAADRAERQRVALERQRADLERQRVALERQRADLERQRAAEEARRRAPPRTAARSSGGWPAMTTKGNQCKLCLKKRSGVFCHFHVPTLVVSTSQQRASGWPAMTKAGNQCKLCLKKGCGVFCHHHR